MRKQIRFLLGPVLFVASIFLLSPGLAWAENHEVVIADSPYPKHNQKLTAVFEDSFGASPGRAWLVLSQSEKELWRKFIPLKADINFAKTDITVNKGRVEILSQFPFTAAFVRQTFIFDGKTITFTSQQRGDASQDEVNALIEIAGHGCGRVLNNWKKEEHEILYPGHYVNGDNVKKILLAGAAPVAKLYCADKAAAAAARLKIAFDASSKLIQLDSNESKISAEPEEWIAAWKSDNIALPVSDFIAILNDYGYYLQLAHRDLEAIAVFNAVIKNQPERAVVYLNLADSLWTLKRVEANAAYQKYSQLLSKTEAKIPDRVTQRLSAPAQSVTIDPAKGINYEPQRKNFR